MKKLILAGLVMSLVGCSSEPADTAEAEKIEAEIGQMTADSEQMLTEAEQEAETAEVVDVEGVVQAFKDAGLPIGQVVVYDEKTDPNKLLNRPNQYVQKVSFEDSSIEQPSPEFLAEGEPAFNGGTIEVFGTEEDALKRKQYVEQVTEGMPMLQQYVYVNGTAVLRLEHEVLPSDAEKYQAIFMESL